MSPALLSRDELWAQLSAVSGYQPQKVKDAHRICERYIKNAGCDGLEMLEIHGERGFLMHIFSALNWDAEIQPANMQLDFRAAFQSQCFLAPIQAV